MKMLNRILQNKQTVAIAGHVRPDGDCVGACMGMYLYLRDNYPDKTIDIYLEEIPEKYEFIEGTDAIRHNLAQSINYDLFICLDTSSIDRLGFARPLLDGASCSLCIDHHISNPRFATENMIRPDASSASELVAGLLDKEKLSVEAAKALYMGIVHDTGVFQYNSTTPDTLRAASELLEKGFDAAELISSTYYEKTYAQNQILGRALLESILFMDGACIAAYITKKQMEFYGVKPADLDGIVSQLRVTKGTEVAIFAYETDVCTYKVSLRSKSTVDVSKVAAFFGGGGHVRAAGCTMEGSIYDVFNNLSEQIALQLCEDM